MLNQTTKEIKMGEIGSTKSSREELYRPGRVGVLVLLFLLRVIA
jgi:hypothetical protein